MGMSAEATSVMAGCPFLGGGAVVGRLRKGAIRAGDVYTLESWQDRVVIVEGKGSRLARPRVDALGASGARVEAERLYTIATTAEVASSSAAASLGKVESSRESVLVRDATIAYLRENGFDRQG